MITYDLTNRPLNGALKPSGLSFSSVKWGINYGLSGLFQHNQPVVITTAGRCHTSRLGYWALWPAAGEARPCGPCLSVSLESRRGGRSCDFWDSNPKSQLPPGWCDGYHAESYSTEEMEAAGERRWVDDCELHQARTEVRVWRWGQAIWGSML